MNWHHILAGNEFWWLAGKFAGVLLVVGYCKLRPRLPHRHTGYTSMNGTRWPCRVCGRAPSH